MFTSTKYHIIWILDGIGLCQDIIQWEIFTLLINKKYDRRFCKIIGNDWGSKSDKCFTLCCRRNYIDAAKLLWSINDPTKFDIAAAFSQLCVNNYLSTAKWLWKVCSNEQTSSLEQTSSKEGNIIEKNRLYINPLKDLLDEYYESVSKMCKYSIDEIKAIPSERFFEDTCISNGLFHASDDHCDILVFLWNMAKKDIEYFPHLLREIIIEYDKSFRNFGRSMKYYHPDSPLLSLLKCHSGTE